MTQQSEPTHDELESLFVNNEALDRIAAYLDRFNPIKVMRMERMEIRHSAILAWLLDPKESHRLDDWFLKAFLGEALRGSGTTDGPTALAVTQADMRDTEVRREWQGIDIFLLSPSHRWAFIIENKFDSQQHEGQLAKYIARVKGIYRDQGADLRIRGIFLTLQDETPQDKSYATLNYDAICGILTRLLELDGSRLEQNVGVFLRHYIEILRDATGMNEERNEMEKLARELYREHRKVLDFVVEHGASSDFIIAAQSLFGENPDYFGKAAIGEGEFRFCGLTNSLVSFLPEAWYQAMGEKTYAWPGCQDWWHGYPLICWAKLGVGAEGTKGQVSLVAEVGPLEPHDVRVDFIRRIQEAAREVKSNRIRFRAGTTDEGRKSSRFFVRNSIEVKDTQEPDEISEAIRTLLRDFQPEFDVVASVIPDFIQYGVRAQ